MTATDSGQTPAWTHQPSPTLARNELWDGELRRTISRKQFKKVELDQRRHKVGSYSRLLVSPLLDQPDMRIICFSSSVSRASLSAPSRKMLVSRSCLSKPRSRLPTGHPRRPIMLSTGSPSFSPQAGPRRSSPRLSSRVPALVASESGKPGRSRVGPGRSRKIGQGRGRVVDGGMSRSRGGRSDGQESRRQRGRSG